MASNSVTKLSMKPMSVQQIVELANDVSFYDPEYTLQQLLRSATLLRKHAAIYEHEGNIQAAYFLLYRYAKLIVDLLPTHKEAKATENRKALSEARKNVLLDLSKLEELKPKIKARYERYHHSTPRSEARRINSPRSATPDMLNADEHSDMAVNIANQETARRAQLWLSASSNMDDGHDLPAHILEARRRMDSASTKANDTEAPASQNQYYYPQITRQCQPLRPVVGQHMSSVNGAPQIPPKGLSMSPPPQRPAKTLPEEEQAQPAVAQFASHSSLESGEALRTIFLPSPLRREFVRIASANTTRNLETCGILCGTLIRNAFFITKLVIPEQTATSDTCEMINEAALHAYVDSFSGTQELMVLGWIHTHPSQTCFLSSRDLHTHVWYQASLPESIAIVCAPSQPAPNDFGVFRMTDPPGMQIVRKCTRPGIFHPHDEADGGIYTDALGRPGHVIEHGDLRFETVDLRP